MPIITEMNGVANFVDLTDGVSVREVTDDATGIASREVVDWKQAAGGTNLVHALHFAMKKARFSRLRTD